MECIVISNPHLETVETLLKEYAKRGWTPCGGISCLIVGLAQGKVEFSQVMTKDDEGERDKLAAQIFSVQCHSLITQVLPNYDYYAKESFIAANAFFAVQKGVKSEHHD